MNNDMQHPGSFFPNSPQYSGCMEQRMDLQDFGPAPLIINLDAAVRQNSMYRFALWTGCYLQTTLMSIPVGGDIGLEIHADFDQFIGVEAGQGIVMMGASREQVAPRGAVYTGYAVFVPAGTWHNLINTGYIPLKLFSTYAPPAHPHGTVQRTKEEAERY